MSSAAQDAFCDELAKIAGITALWDTFKDFFSPESKKAKFEIAEHFKSTDSKKWDRFINNAAKSQEFIDQLKKSKKSDEKLVLHAVNMGALKKAPISGEVESQTQSGTKYQVKKLPTGYYGCTCNDWRYKGSVNPGYECKHIKAHKSGLNKVASFREVSAAFFDELQKIRHEEMKKVYEGLRSDQIQTAKPYSDLLTPGETTYYNPRPAHPADDPEVIVGGSFAR